MKPGDKVILTGLPMGFVDDLPQEDQRAITAVVGTAISLTGFDEDGRAELEFVEPNGIFHTIYIAREFIRPQAERRS